MKQPSNVNLADIMYVTMSGDEHMTVSCLARASPKNGRCTPGENLWEPESCDRVGDRYWLVVASIAGGMTPKK